MEDADIHEADLGDGNSLFAVFDGHGGNRGIIKVTKSANLLRAIISAFSRTGQHTNSEVTSRLSNNRSDRWIF